ncbi:hypothetical protein [Streptomyces albogriseolus]|uniref:hypothetical protein n=1 Tax=Streptomyces albogriseolus TaxID=1887 RepID=UPI0037FE4639
MAGGFLQGGDGGARTADAGDGSGINTFPFPVERSVRGARDAGYRGTVLAMQPGPDRPASPRSAPRPAAGCAAGAQDTVTLPPSLHTAVPRHASTASLLRLVERGFATRHRVTASADAFGCSLRTLARVVLEAKRLLRTPSCRRRGAGPRSASRTRRAFRAERR